MASPFAEASDSNFAPFVKASGPNVFAFGGGVFVTFLDDLLSQMTLKKKFKLIKFPT